jgi:hypothetical protein
MSHLVGIEVLHLLIRYPQLLFPPSLVSAAYGQGGPAAHVVALGVGLVYSLSPSPRFLSLRTACATTIGIFSLRFLHYYTATAALLLLVVVHAHLLDAV